MSRTLCVFVCMADMKRQPGIFISHGGGPCFWIEFPAPLGPHAFDGLRRYLQTLSSRLPQLPDAILIVSGHWEESSPTVMTSARPPLLYDYYGFPEHTYTLQYGAPGAPQLAARVGSLLGEAGIESREDGARGFDHGVFVPMLMVDPDGRIPVTQLSLQHDLDAAAHLAIGDALAPLRDENVLILGSGNSYHNLGEFFDGCGEASARFDGWLTGAVTNPDPAMRRESLIHWQKAPAARQCHPRAEHLLPLMVVAGAGGADTACRDYHDIIGGKAISGYRFG
jgi:aromatic ring-opening dioxygenase catalytic subunit (LigB family)